MRFRKNFRLTLIVSVVGILPAFNGVLAQGGNAGGSIAKERKVLSGEQSNSSPTSKPRSRVKQARAAPTAGARSITGTWSWTGQCARYKEPYVGTISFQQTGASFTGSHGGTNMWDKGTVSNGRIIGNRVTFQRTFGQYVDDLSLTLSSSGRQMSGVIPDTAHSGRCVMTFFRP
jgi:hypothetical protein